MRVKVNPTHPDAVSILLDNNTGDEYLLVWQAGLTSSGPQARLRLSDERGCRQPIRNGSFGKGLP